MLYFLVFAGLALIVGCGAPTTPSEADAAGETAATGPAKHKVELALNWFPEAEHGGFYAALAHGYYADEGLDVTIRPGGPDAPVIPLVARGTVMFGVSNADNLLFARAQEADVIALMAPLQTSPRCILVHKQTGIRRLIDLKNVTLAVTPGAAFAEYLKSKAPLEGVKIVPYSGTVAMFLLHEDYAQQGYVFSEPYVARQQGVDPEVLMMSDLGFNPYASVLFTSQEVLRDQRDLARRMVAASQRGWREYLDSPAETNELIHSLNPEMDLDILEYGAKAMRPLVIPADDEASTIGAMSAERWRTLIEQLETLDLLPVGAVKPEAIVTNDYLSSSSPPPR